MKKINTKKIGLFVLSVFAVLLTTVLSACGTRGASVEFDQAEYVFFVNSESSQKVDFSAFIKSTSGVQTKDLTFSFSDEQNSIFERKNSTTFVPIKSGRCEVYAIFNQNVVGSAKVVVGRPFSAPTQFFANDNNEFTWAYTGEAFDQLSTELAQPLGFVVEGTFTAISQEDETLQQPTDFHQEVASNTITLAQAGIYKLKVKAKGNEKKYFSESQFSAEQTVYINFMGETKVVGWQDGVLSWSLASIAQKKPIYQVKLGEWTSSWIEENEDSHINTLDLTAQFEKLDAGRYDLSIFAKDNSENENKKHTQETVISITKLAQPNVVYEYASSEGGKIKIVSSQNPTKYQVKLSAEDGSDKTILLLCEQQTNDTYLDLSNEKAGLYDVSVTAFKDTVVATDGYFFHSATKAFDNKVYKLEDVTFEGQADNECNSNSLLGTVESLAAARFATKFQIFGLEENPVAIAGFTIDQSRKTSVGIPLQNAGTYNVSIGQIPERELNSLLGSNVWVVNSNQSETFTIAKAGAFTEELKHRYELVNDETVSVLSTAAAELADDQEKYVLYQKTQTGQGILTKVQASLYTLSVENGKVVVTFSDRIENLFQPVENSYIFVLQTKIADENTCINSSVEKTIQILPAPTKAEQQTVGTFAWNAVEGAGAYKVKLYSVSKQIFEAQNLDVDTNWQDVQLVKEIVLQGNDNTLISLEDAGYFYIEVFAQSQNVNLFLDGQVPLKSLITKTEATTLGSIKFGHTDQPFSDFLEQTEQTGYYLQIENTKNVSNFVIFVDGQPFGSPVAKFEGSSTLIFLDLDFSANKEISIQGHSADDAIFLPTEKISFSVQRHPAVRPEDLEFDENTNTVLLRSSKFQDVGGFQIYFSDEICTTTRKGEDAKLDISTLSGPFSLKFVLFDQSNTPQKGDLGQKFSISISKNEKVFLGSVSTISFSRLNAPTLMSFLNGKLNFQTEKQQNDKTEFYVVDVVCTRSDNSQETFSVRFEEEVKVAYQNQAQQGFGKATDFVNVSDDLEISNISISMDKILDLIKQNSALKLNFDQIASLKFSVWAYACKTDEGAVLISSKPATTPSGALEVEVERLKMGQVRFNAQTGNLEWDAVNAPDGVTEPMQYQIYTKQDENFQPTTTVATTYYHLESAELMFADGKDFSFYVVATNAQCVASNNSNLVNIQKLSALKAVTLSENATLGLSLGQQEAISSGVKYKIDGVDDGSYKTVEDLQKGVQILQPGTYRFVVLGKTVENVSQFGNGLNDISYFLDSDEAVWNVFDMKNEKVAPNNSKVTLSGTTISWNAFGGSENLQSLQYQLIFKQTLQGKTQIATFNCATTSVNLADPSLADLRASLETFAEGEISVFVYAKLNPYLVPVVGNVFFANSQTLADGTLRYNHFLYNGNSDIFAGDPLEKLAQPKEVIISFVDALGMSIAEENENLSSAQNPHLRLSFAGDYGNAEVQFALYAIADEQQSDGQEQFLTYFSISQNESGKFEYTFDLSLANFAQLLSAEGKKATLKIVAISRQDKQAQIPSSAATVQLERAQNLQDVQFVEKTDGTFGFDAKIRIYYTDAQTLAGGVVLKVLTVASGEVEPKETYLYVPFSGEAADTLPQQYIVFPDEATDALRAVLNKNLPNGGSVCVQAFANNFSNEAERIYQLASLQSAVSKNFIVLAPLKQENLVATEYGFEIVSNPNSAYDGTVYVVKYNGQTFLIEKNDNSKFEFVFPDNWTDGEYPLVVFATHSDVETLGALQQFVQSAALEITYTIKRATRVESVTLSRDETTHKQQLSWQDVEKSNGYILQVFSYNNGQKGELLSTEKIDKSTGVDGLGVVKVDVLQVLANNNTNKLAEILSENTQLCFELTTLGSIGQDDDFCNSKIFSFVCQIKENSLTAESFYAPFGVLYASAVSGEKYMYRVVNEDGEVLQAWKSVVAENGLAKFEFETETLENFDVLSQNKPMYIQTIVLGSDEAAYPMLQSPAVGGGVFVLDSLLHSTKTEQLQLFKMADIENISYQPENEDGITITLPRADKLFVGLDENALQNSTQQLPKVAPIVLQNPQTSTGSNVFKISFMQILDALESSNIKLPEENETFNLYFWAIEEFDGAISEIFPQAIAASRKMYLASQAYAFECGIVGTKFLQIVKLSQIDEGYNPLCNHFALFDNTDDAQISTVGIYVRISRVDGDGTKTHLSTKFVNKATLLKLPQNVIFENKFAVDLLSLFAAEQQQNLSQVFGSLCIDFAKVATKVEDGKNIYLSSNWLEATWQDATGKSTNIFQRLSDAENICLQQGNLLWDGAQEQSDFYVYFVPKLLQNGGENLQSNGLFAEFSHFLTNQKFLNPAAAEVSGNRFYIAVQSRSDSVGVLASNICFLTDPENAQSKQPFEVYKNQILSKFLLEDGKLSLQWQKADLEDDFVSVFANQEIGIDEVVKKLMETRFASPASFTLEDLFSTQEDQVLKVRFRFSPILGAEGISKSVDVPLVNVLASLQEFWNNNLSQGQSFEERLQQLVTASNQNETFVALQNFVQQKYFGIATAGSLFDDFMEKLSAGGWKMEYCLLGNNKTLTSHWQTFEIDGQASVFVNNAPNIKIVRETQHSAYVQPMKVVITLSTIYAKGEDGTVAQNFVAQNYVLRIGNLSFAISNTSVVLLGAESDNSVKVYQCNAAGATGGDWDGKHIMFYLDYNAKPSEGGSLVSVFQSQLDALWQTNNTGLRFEIVAIGNNVGFSSKSEVYELNLLHFENFAIENGVFTWANAQNRTTAVVRDRDTAAEEVVTKDVNQVPITTTYSLNDAGADKYNYVKFVILGGVEGNKIFVDSEILQLKNVYKLAAPSLTNDFGNILVNSMQNASYYQFYHSNIQKRTFKVYNNTVDESSGITFTGESDNTAYEVGTTGLEETEPEFAYKTTEANANQFYVQSVGSTANFEVAQDENDYYLKNLFPLDLQGQKLPQLQVDGAQVDVGVAAQSEFSILDAAMLEKVANAKVEDGKLVWDAVFGASSAFEMQILPQEVVYKVTVEHYKNSYGAQGTDSTPVGAKEEYFTKQTFFDFANIQKTDYDNEEAIYISATIQPLALQNVLTEAQNAKTLVEDETSFVGGNVQYQGTKTFVLMGNGQVVNKIVRLNSVDEKTIRIEKGRLVWDYAPLQPVAGVEEFENLFSFAVFDDDLKCIVGSTTVEQDVDNENLYHITFEEAALMMKSGTYQISIVVVPKQTTLPQEDESDMEKPINSYAAHKTITKLPTVEDEYEILSDTLFETLSFEKYFFAEDGSAKQEVQNNTITATFTLQNQSGAGEQKVFEFNSQNHKLMILKALPSAEQPPVFEEHYINDYLVVADGDNWTFTLKVSNETDISSDQTSPRLMNRSTLDGVEIEWNENSQMFVWNFDNFLQFEQNQEKPTFVVQATYELENSTVTRIYQTENQFFTPTIVTGQNGSVMITLRVKINSTSILSAEIASSKQVFNLFQSGDGSSEETAYIISSEQQFKNIAHRLQKDANLCTFSNSTGASFATVTESERYYFSINPTVKTLNLGDFEGFAISNNTLGGFEGVLNGNGCTISYNSNNVASLAENVVVGINSSPLVPTDPREDLVYSNGCALFESLESCAEVKNLNLSASFGNDLASTQTTVSGNCLVSALAVKNAGTVSNIEVVGFKSSLKTRGSLALLAYAGVVGSNETQNAEKIATISECKLLCDISVSDYNVSTFTSVAGIAYTNFGSISNCQIGTSGTENVLKVEIGGLTSRVQVGGISVANAHSAASINNCKNFCQILVGVQEGRTAQSMAAVAAGIVVLGQGTVSCPDGNSKLPQIDAAIEHQKSGNIFAGNTTSEFNNF